jgi:hypothetical protein
MKIQYSVVVKIILFLLITFCYPCFVASQVTKEEYKIYSAFINQAYLDANFEWFTIDGTKIKWLVDIDKIEQVVISPITIQTLHDNEILARSMKQLQKKLVANYLKQNLKSYKFDDKFKTDLEHYLLPVNKDGWNTIEIEARRQNVSYEKLFFEKYPKAVGALYFSRIGFDSSRKTALLAVSQLDTFDRKRAGVAPHPKFVILSKQTEAWKVKEIFPKNDNIRIVNLQKCKPETIHLGLAEGSISIEIKGIKNGKCQIKEEDEIEQGYTRVECLIPQYFRKIFITPNAYNFVYSKNISSYCSTPITGNYNFDRISKDNN